MTEYGILKSKISDDRKTLFKLYITHWFMTYGSVVYV